MLLAKSKPKTETLVEHTNELMKRYNQLITLYGDILINTKVWNLLRFAALYHDAGKAYTHFQYTIKKSLGYRVEKPNLVHIPHNYLSPLFLPLSSLKLDKHSRRVLIEAITYHHERDTTLLPEQLKKVGMEDLVPRFSKIQRKLETLDIELPKDGRFFDKILDDMSRKRIKRKNGDEHYLTYVLVKGLLHRLDHAASAHVDIEIDGNFDLSELAEKYLQQITGKQTGYLRPLQQFALDHQDKNLILTAQTGMGKTEAALLWSGKKKTFFTVPLRVSLNALFDRVSIEMNYKNCGLLHSTSAHYLDEKDIEDWEVIYDQSMHFSNKIIFTTIDQILKFPFKFRGYEKYYATLAHSCIIIDEIQAYSPWIVAVIIKAIEMIHHIGGKFMIMTATLPHIYLETLQEKGVIDEGCVVKTLFDDSPLRHRIALEKKSIHDDIDKIAKASQQKKVLVITNTVNEAIKIYEDLLTETDDVYLFHSRFIQKDRQLLERSLKKFDKDRERPGVWVTTQIVEASIDIDFDELYTELATLDSLFQRFGRCYRKRALQSKDVNIRIYTEKISGRGYIYDREILDKSEAFLQNHINKNGHEINESQKMKLVKELYSRKILEGTTFLKDFIQAQKELDHIEDYSITFTEAQKILRGDQAVMIIPRQKYDEIIPLFEELETESNSKKRTKIRREIERYTCSVQKNMFSGYLYPIEHYRRTKSGKYPLMNHLFILDKDYDFDHIVLKGIGIKIEDASFEVV